MKARIYRIVSNKPDGSVFTAELESEATLHNVLDVIAQAKKRFNLWGKAFILVTEDSKTFMITKVEKKWYSYEMKGPDDAVSNE